MSSEQFTISRVLDRAREVFKENFIRDPERNAQLLLQHMLKIDTAELIGKMNDEMSMDQVTVFSALVKRRLRREPLQYITRRAEFWSLNLYVDQRVLIPRPESEHIIEAVLDDFPERNKTTAIVDVGTGSGCLSVALATEFSKSKVFAIDLDPGALEVATINASRINVSNKVTFLRGDLLTPLKSVKSPRNYHIIVSNPPYISKTEEKSLEPEVIKAEPKKALVAGNTGYEVYARLIPQLSSYLKKDGLFYLEIGEGQERTVKKMIDDENELSYVRTVEDLQSIPRVVVGTRRR